MMNNRRRMLMTAQGGKPPKPSVTPSLRAEVEKPGEYREIKDAILPTEAFALGEIGWYGERTRLYKSLIANNVYTPITYPAGWEML